jgi:hypothetical protein
MVNNGPIDIYSDAKNLAWKQMASEGSEQALAELGTAGLL